MRNPRNESLTPATTGTRQAKSARTQPERTCILGSGQDARDALLRLALAPDGMVLPDVHGRAPGRGAWIGVDRAGLEDALASGRLRPALLRAFKGGVKDAAHHKEATHNKEAAHGTSAPLQKPALNVPADLPERIEQALRRSFTDRLGLEMRAGHLILGTGRIADQARMGRVFCLAHAADASEDGCRKLDQAWRVGQGMEGSGRQGVRLPLDRAALSVALGRENVVHLAVADRAAAQRVMTPLRRLLHYAGAVNVMENDPGNRGVQGTLGHAGMVN